MPKLKTLKVPYNGPDNEYLTCSVPVSVNAAGEFYCAIPVVLEDMITFEYIKTEFPKTKYMGEKIISPSLSQLEIVLKTSFAAYSKPEITERIVIQYKVSSHFSAWQKLDGTLVPNGYYDEKPTGERGVECGDWLSGSNKSQLSEKPYGVEVFARVALETTTTRGTSVSVKYKSGNALAKAAGKDVDLSLNDYTQMGHDPREDLTVIPYTPEAARFFFDLAAGITKLGHMFNQFFEQEVIDFTNGPLLLNKDKDNE